MDIIHVVAVLSIYITFIVLFTLLLHVYSFYDETVSVHKHIFTFS